MNLAVDVHYADDDRAVVAGVLFPDWTAPVVVRSEVLSVDGVAAYRPGRFFERELPCILALLDVLGTVPQAIVIDGYVTLGADGREGLGARLHTALAGAVPVVGVAKSRFAGTPPETEVLRGASRRPLYVTSRGLPAAEARRLVAAMHGPYRLPTVLAIVDRLCRNGAPTGRAEASGAPPLGGSGS